MRESVTKGKKIWKESGFSSSRFGGFFEGGWYIYVREEKERGILWIALGEKNRDWCTRVSKGFGRRIISRRKELSQSCRVCFLLLFFIPVYIQSSMILWPFLNIQSLLIGVDGRATISSIEIGCFFVYLRLSFFSMSLISYENNMHLGQSLILMMEILPCSCWKSVLNHSPILSQWIEIWNCGFSWLFSSSFCVSFFCYFLLFLAHTSTSPIPDLQDLLTLIQKFLELWKRI